MKKIFILALPAILFLLFITGCGNPLEKDITENTAPSDLYVENVDPKDDGDDYIDYIEESAPDTTTVNDDESYFDKLEIEILESIKAGDYEKFAEYIWATNPESYRFIQDMTVDSYEIVETIDSVEYSPVYFKVKFDISQSNNEYFPVGESYWDLALGDGPDGSVKLFRPSNEENYKLTNRSERIRDKDYNFCYYFSQCLGIYQTADDFNAVLNEATAYWGGILHAIVHFYGSTAPDRASPLYADILKDYMIKTTGITAIDYTDSGRYNAQDDISNVCVAHGGSWLYWRPISKEYDESTKTYTVVIDYCADTALFATAKTIKYKFTENDDGTYKMLSTELLYDSGYSIQNGSV